MYKIAGIFIIGLVSISAFGQQVDVPPDTVKVRGDSLRGIIPDSTVIRKGRKIITVESYAKRFQPRKAILYAAILPGMGQVYNKKYWKLPLVYGGFYALTSFAIAYNNLFIKYKTQLFGLLETPSIPPPSGFTETQLRTVIDTYRRQRDYFIILDMFMYILQLVDAHVDAHLKEFDLNPQLKVGFKPNLQYNLAGLSSGISVTFTF